MFRYVLSLTFAVGLASAATISTFAGCDGVAMVGTFSAFCNDGHFMASAVLFAPSFVDTRIAPLPEGAFEVSVDVRAIQFGPPFPPEPVIGSASANFSDDYVFTVYGGTGNGLFCAAVMNSFGSGASAGITFGGFPCPVTLNPTFLQPFTFGVPQIISISMFGQASAVFNGQSDASALIGEPLAPIAFFDPAGHPLPNVTFTLVEVPEPSTWSMLTMGLIFVSGGIRCLSTFFLSH
jgi:hypothetical protein